MWWIKRKQKAKDDSIFTLRDKHQRFYQTKEWQRLRLHKLAIDPCCEIYALSGMTVPATIVDHIQSLTLRYDLGLEIDNLQSLDEICHNKKSRQEQIEYKRMERERM